MKGVLGHLIFLFLALTSVTHADDWGGCWTRPGFAFQTELLYFKVSNPHEFFVHDLSATPGDDPRQVVDVSRIVNKVNYRPGFRIGGDLCLFDCENRFQARYAYLYNGHQKTVSGLLIPIIPNAPQITTNPNGEPGTAVSRINMHYHAADVVWQRYLFMNSAFDLDFLFGLHGALFRYKENIRIAFAPSPTPPAAVYTSWDSKCWGIGPEIGVRAHYMFNWPCNLSLAGDFRAMLLACRPKTSLTQRLSSDAATLVFTDTPITWSVTPAVDGKLGLNYALNCSRYLAGFEIGYEWLWYSSVIQKIIITGATTTISLKLLDDAYLHGPYAALRVQF